MKKALADPLKHAAIEWNLNLRARPHLAKAQWPPSTLPSERPPFERIALILQGGGALGAYQAGVYQALAEATLHPDWVAGISIG
jgi:predicted acylesterase/phospholipase RssA